MNISELKTKPAHCLSMFICCYYLSKTLFYIYIKKNNNNIALSFHFVKPHYRTNHHYKVCIKICSY